MGQEAHLLKDIRLQLRHREFRPVYAVADVRRSAPGGKGTMLDLDTVEGEENLIQAVIIRLLTPMGELTTLGHPGFGSRLHELVGRENTETTRNLIRLRILESLQQEPRIQEVVDVTVTLTSAEATVNPNVARRSSADVSILITPIESTQTVHIGPFTLELGL